MEEYDLVVVGAGIYGLPVAKTYLEVNPSARVLILDANKSTGGTWAEERIYDELRSNNQVGSLEFSDFPMDFETFGVLPDTHVPGMVMHKYLTSYARNFGLFDRTRFDATVKTAELKDDGTWAVMYELKTERDISKEMFLVAKKLVMATGTTSEPNLPSIPGSDSFGGDIFHFKEILDRAEEMSRAENVVVMGGSKSSADAVYINATKGRHVDWVIRASGRGPSWIATPCLFPTRLKIEDIVIVRFVTWLVPCFDVDAYPKIRYLLHNTIIGRAISRGFFSVLQMDLLAAGKFNSHPETKKLIPPDNFVWSGTSIGIFNYPRDLFGLVKQGLIDIHIADITSLSDHTVHLSTGTSIPASVLICATGWKLQPTVTILPSNLSNKTGFSTVFPPKITVKAADEEMFHRYPELKPQRQFSTMPSYEREKEEPSFALYRGMVPPAFLHTRNLAYSGVGAVGIRTFLIAEIQSLWITAFLDNKLSVDLPSEGEAEWKALLQSRFYKWRAKNGLGSRITDMAFETLPFVDTLMRELGLEGARKRKYGGGWLREVFEWYTAEDYKGVVREWMEKTEGREEKEVTSATCN